MKDRVDEEIVRYLWWLRPVLNEEAAAAPVRRAPQRRAPLVLNDPGADAATSSVFGAPRSAAATAAPPRATATQQQPPRVGGDDAVQRTVRHEGPKVGRNDPCPCGSGKKYKKCHGAAA
ncbi:MAG: SEC-C domain-containing protein [Acidobacteria bacterium]|nr:SEC-C domain-containing protein [Acidobacteriota bacterium]